MTRFSGVVSPGRWRRVVPAATAGVLFAAVTLVVAQGGTAGVDLAGHAWALHHRGGMVARAAAWVTQAGRFGLILPVVLLVGLLVTAGGWWRRTRAAVLMGVVFGGGALVRIAVADLVARPRPPREQWLGPAGGFAFPSGHSTAATLGAGLVAWALTRRMTRAWPRAAVWTAAGTYAAAVGWSRVWLGVHWPADVVGAWLLAAMWLCVARFLTARPADTVSGEPDGRLAARAGNS